MSEPLVSRAGGKLQHALETFDIDVTGLRCVDLGCNVGGFTDCLLRRGAESVIAVDTGYGILAWKLRQDPRVYVRERTNALHTEPPDGGVDLVVIDLGWTPQRHALPAARRWLAPGGRIVSLVKPHYELDEAGRRVHLKDGRLDDAIAETMLQAVLESLEGMQLRALSTTRSPIRGGKSSRGKGQGNREFLLLAEAV
ncbi:MAG: SAM-dependent methyltransferase [Phycisphaerales bacterium]|nr:SAM-dependent methyltransferase [Phycisphaerales bacterium]MDP6311329.1 SAM-dependent methyltransferase [Phycisphaerales bacterium]MDP7086766.1 SAM-dependent methyltransferase [Phycisphaerales bacterium]MDP7189479.1 SAM-dependent methyltransferase [Phycisphaerales bacterium]MDP7520493.1 SAM-dependent methyltransferase [Phycisphaerales bacterium]